MDIDTNNETIWNKLITYINKLYELIKNDIHNSYLFLLENKKYITYIIVMALLMQITSISHLRIIKCKYNYNIQKGGNEKSTITDLNSSKKLATPVLDMEMKEINNTREESKINQKRISFFENIKNKFGKGGTSGGRYGMLGPVFGNMDRIFDSVKTVFYILAIILTIVGIISIPVLIFLIITYMVIKLLVKRFTIL